MNELREYAESLGLYDERVCTEEERQLALRCIRSGSPIPTALFYKLQAATALYRVAEVPRAVEL